MGQHFYVVRFVTESLSSLSLDKLIFAREDIKTEYCLPLGSDDLNRKSAAFFIHDNRKFTQRAFYCIQKPLTCRRKNEVSEMIETINESSINESGININNRTAF